MKRIIAFALVLVVFMFATTITVSTISIPKINTIYPTANIESNVVPSGDPIDGGPPGIDPPP